MLDTSVSTTGPAGLLATQWRPNFPPAFAVPAAVAELRAAALTRPRLEAPTGVLTHSPYHRRGALDGRYGGVDEFFYLAGSPSAVAAEGPQWYATVGPGLVQIGRLDPARAERARERAYRAHGKLVDLVVAWNHAETAADAVDALYGVGLVNAPGKHSLDPLARSEPCRAIREWSAKSRVNMIRRICSLDFEPLLADGVPAMVTLTLPDRWAEIAPKGRTMKRLLDVFRKRFARKWGRPLRCVWKLEFQRRGAPHVHLLMVPPADGGEAWREWFASTWAAMVARGVDEYFDVYRVHRHWKASADFAEGLRATDPKHIGVYFLKHNTAGDKEYQHLVPAEWQGEGDGPGRFWGYWGLDRADLSVWLTAEQALSISRTLNRWSRSQRARRKVRVWRADERTGTVRQRTVTRRVVRMRQTSGFLAVNDGPSIALALAESLTP